MDRDERSSSLSLTNNCSPLQKKFYGSKEKSFKEGSEEGYEEGSEESYKEGYKEAKIIFISHLTKHSA
jgi:flagellar biosynthesis/type III secretory pathway protein FliH